MLQPKSKTARQTRFNIRATARQKEIIARAAAQENKTVSEFVLENALEAAEALLLDNAYFVLSREKYEEFVTALDEPPQSIATLRQLFAEESLLDQPK